MKSFCRKSYNSKYYSQNRDQILHRRHEKRTIGQTTDGFGQLSLFDGVNACQKNSNNSRRIRFGYLINALLVLLVAANSYYLLSEAVAFYQVNSATFESAVLAAVTVELLLLALSVIKPSSTILKLTAKTTLILLFVYSSWSFCSKVIGTGFQDLDQSAMVQSQIQRLQTQVAERSLLIDANIQHGRITMASKLADEKAKLGDALDRLVNDSSKAILVSPKAQLANVLALVALRLLLQVSNIIIVHYLASLLGRSPKRRGQREKKLARVIRLVDKAVMQA